MLNVPFGMCSSGAIYVFLIDVVTVSLYLSAKLELVNLHSYYILNMR